MKEYLPSAAQHIGADLLDRPKGQESSQMHVSLLNSSGIVDSTSIHWDASYINESGTKITVKESDGNSFSLVPLVNALYTVQIASSDSSLKLLGLLSKTFNVNY